jgi:hypothetical protein
MSGLSQFVGGSRAPRVIVQANATPSWVQWNLVSTYDQSANAKVVASGALTANTLSTVLSVTGGGQLNYLSITSVDATSRTHRLVLTIDGTSVYDYTSASFGTANAGAVIVGNVAIGVVTVGLEQIEFKTSLTVQIASSLSETAKTNVGYKYKAY